MQPVVADRVKFSTEKQNYIKAQLALDFTRIGLKDFVKDGINTVHQTIMQTLSKRTPCKSCSIANVVKCPIKGLCKGRPCQMHSVMPYAMCRNAFCDSFMSEINRSYRYPTPTWQNTVTEKWSTDPWQIAKCFLPTGYDKCTSADDTDLPGLIHIITSCMAFQAKVTENIGAPRNIFHQVRESRNHINHSPTMEMPEAVLSDHIAKMIDVLEDPAFLVNHAPAKDAVDKLEKLRTEPLLMTRAEEQQIKMEARNKYEEDKKRLQSHLADQYLIQFSKISLSPLVSEITANVDDVSVPQSMKQVKLSHETEHEGKQQTLPHVKSYADIFTRNSQECKNIYIKGEPGAGKSFLSQRIALAWSKFIKGEIIEDDDDFIKRFSLLFYISLRYIRDENNLEEMILKHPLLECDGFDDLIKRILRDESSVCLIVVDGLDEWSSTQTTATLSISKGLPLRNVTKRCTTVTTTRPWKLATIRMKPAEMDQLIELTGIDTISSEKYIRSLVERLNEKHGLDRHAYEFINKLRSHDLGAFMTLPVLLKYLVCLWHAGKPIGNSQCEIYSGLLDLLLQLPEKESACRNEALESLKQTTSTINLPSCFKGKQNCSLFGSLLQRLSKLAFHTLFVENQESSLVFNSSSAEIHGMSKTDIQACLNIGILSQDIVMEQCAIPEMSLSFLHKTFQEFLAAVYMYMFTDHTDSIYTTVSEYCSSVERVLEVSKVLVFMSGMCPAMVSRLSEHVAGVVSGDEQVQTYRESVDVEYPEYPPICENVQYLMASCIEEAKYADPRMDLAICIKDFILQYEQYEDLNSYTKEYTPDTEHLRQLLQSSNGHITSIVCTNGTINEYLDMLQHVTQTGVLQRLAVEGDFREDYIPLSRLSGIIQQSRDSIKCLVLRGITCTDLPLKTLSQLFEGLSHLEAIKLEAARLSLEQAVWLVSHLLRRTGIRHIHLTRLECPDDQCGPGSESSGSETEYESIESETEPEIIEPETEIIEPETERIEPEPERIEPETEIIEPEPERIEPEPEIIEPEPEIIVPEPEIIEPETERIEPETERIEPETECIADHSASRTHRTALRQIHMAELECPDDQREPRSDSSWIRRIFMSCLTCKEPESQSIESHSASRLQITGFRRIPMSCLKCTEFESELESVEHQPGPRSHTTGISQSAESESESVEDQCGPRSHSTWISQRTESESESVEDQCGPRSHSTWISQRTESESESVKSESDRLNLDLTSHTQLTTLNLNGLDIHDNGYMNLPTSCPQLTTLKLCKLHTAHIQLPTSCPQLTTLELRELRTDRIQLPTSCPQLTTLKLLEIHTDQIQMPTSCPQLTTLTLCKLHTDHIQLPTSCPQLTTLTLGELHADRIQLPTDMSHLQSCTLRDIHTRGVTVSVLQALRHSSHLHKLYVSTSDDEIPEVTDAVIDVLPTLHYIRDIALGKLHIDGRQLRLSPLITHLEWVRLFHVTLTRESLHNFIDSIVEIPHTMMKVMVELEKIKITPDTDTDSALEYIRSSSRCVVTWDDRDIFMFLTTDQTSQ